MFACGVGLWRGGGVCYFGRMVWGDVGLCLCWSVVGPSIICYFTKNSVVTMLYIKLFPVPGVLLGRGSVRLCSVFFIVCFWVVSLVCLLWTCFLSLSYGFLFCFGFAFDWFCSVS